jgi:hypothetical protein
LGQSALLVRLSPDTQQFGLDLATHAPGHSVQDIALFVQQTALSRRGREQLPHGGQQSVMTIGDDEIYLGGSAPA